MYMENTSLGLVGTYRLSRTEMGPALGTTCNAYFNRFGLRLRSEIALRYR